MFFLISYGKQRHPYSTQFKLNLDKEICQKSSRQMMQSPEISYEIWFVFWLKKSAGIYRTRKRDHQHREEKLQISSQSQNLYFHLSLRCVFAKYPMFLRSDLKIDQDMYAYITPEHIIKLFSEFNVVA